MEFRPSVFDDGHEDAVEDCHLVGLQVEVLVGVALAHDFMAVALVQDFDEAFDAVFPAEFFLAASVVVCTEVADAV